MCCACYEKHINALDALRAYKFFYCPTLSKVIIKIITGVLVLSKLLRALTVAIASWRSRGSPGIAWNLFPLIDCPSSSREPERKIIQVVFSWFLECCCSSLLLRTTSPSTHDLGCFRFSRSRSEPLVFHRIIFSLVFLFSFSIRFTATPRKIPELRGFSRVAWWVSWCCCGAFARSQGRNPHPLASRFLARHRKRVEEFCQVESDLDNQPVFFHSSQFLCNVKRTRDSLFASKRVEK